MTLPTAASPDLITPERLKGRPKEAGDGIPWVLGGEREERGGCLYEPCVLSGSGVNLMLQPARITCGRGRRGAEDERGGRKVNKGGKGR